MSRNTIRTKRGDDGLEQYNIKTRKWDLVKKEVDDISREKDMDNNLKVFNDKNRLVKDPGAPANKYLDANYATRYGNPNVKSAAPYKEGLVRTQKGWNWINFKREFQTTVKKMVNAIIKQIKDDRSNIFVTLRYYDDSGVSYLMSTKLRKEVIVKGKEMLENLTSKELFDKLVNRAIDGAVGSDKQVNSYELDTTFFRVYYRKLAGGSVRNKFNVEKTDYYKVTNFKCEEGDCLLAILRNDKTRFYTIRKNLELKDGLIDIKEIPKIEDYFETNINILEDAIKIKRISDDTIEKNRTIVEWEQVYIYKSDNKYGETKDILLKDNHYSLIQYGLEVYFDKVCGDELKRKKLNGDDLPYIPMTKKQREKSLLRQGRKIAGEEKIEYIHKLLFFDIETIFDSESDNLLRTYSVAWWSCKAEEEPPRFTESNIVKYVKQTNMKIGRGSMDEFINWIENNDKGIKYTLIGYNNSRFDNFPLLEGVIKSGTFTNMMFVQNAILKLKFYGRHEVFDLVRFVSASLKNACRDFKTYPQKMEGFSHFIPQDAFEKDGWGGLNSWIEDNSELLTKYNKYDVLATANLFFVVRFSYNSITQRDILQYTTLASLSYDVFRKSMFIGKKKGYLAPAPKNIVDDIWIRKAIIGGRCQFFKVGFDKNEKLYCVDVKSLYPYIMLNRQFPILEYEYTQEYKKDKLGIYCVEVVSQPLKRIIPDRNEKGLNWEATPLGKDIYLTSVEIECIRRHGGEVRFKQLEYHEDRTIGIYWKNSYEHLFRPHLNPIKDEKTRQDILAKLKDDQYNPALRNIAKLLLNSLSGKTIQRNFDTAIEMVKNNTEQEKFIDKMKDGSVEFLYSSSDYIMLKGELKTEKIYDEKKAKPSYLGIFIYAYARTYMYDMLYSKYDVLYTDTDSAIMKEKDYLDFSKKFIVKKGKGVHAYYEPLKNGEIPTIGNQFGQFEEEFQAGDESKAMESYIITKKVYAIEIKEKGVINKQKSKYRLKGVNLKRDCYITEELANEIINVKKEIKRKIENGESVKKDTLWLYEKYKECYANRDKDRIKIFRTLNEQDERGNKKCYFYCSRINKKDLVMKQAFTIKIITKEDLEMNIMEEIDEL